MTPLYSRMMAAQYNDEKTAALMEQVWSGTPWMVDAKTGSTQHGRCPVREWCHEHFGPEAWPIHGKPGDWHFGSATIHGWTWMGFKTEEMMIKFCERWETREDQTVSNFTAD